MTPQEMMNQMAKRKFFMDKSFKEWLVKEEDIDNARQLDRSSSAAVKAVAKEPQLSRYGFMKKSKAR
jgi:hypothetical protein